MTQGYYREFRNNYGDKIVIQDHKEGYMIHIHHGSSVTGGYCETMEEVINEMKDIMKWRDATEEAHIEA